MKRTFVFLISFLAFACRTAVAIEAPTGLVSRSGDRSIVLHWDRNLEPNLSGYRVYRSLSNGGPFVAQRTPHATPSSPALQASHTRTLINPYQSGRREASLAHLPDKQSRGELFTPSCCWAIRRVRNPPHASTTSVVPLPRTGGLSSGRSLPQAFAILSPFGASPYKVHTVQSPRRGRSR